MSRIYQVFIRDDDDRCGSWNGIGQLGFTDEADAMACVAEIKRANERLIAIEETYEPVHAAREHFRKRFGFYPIAYGELELRIGVIEVQDQWVPEDWS